MEMAKKTLSQIKDESGFTLIESLMTLFFVSLMLGLPTVGRPAIQQKVAEEWFFNELESQLQAAQTYAIVSGYRSSITTQPKAETIIFTNNQEHSLPLQTTLALPKHMSLSNRSVITVDYKPNSGNASMARTIGFMANKKRKRLTIQLGSGRYFISDWE